MYRSCTPRNLPLVYGRTRRHQNRQALRIRSARTLGFRDEISAQGIHRRSPDPPGGDHARRVRRLRRRTGRVQRRKRTCAPTGELPTQGRAAETGQQPQRRLIQADAPRVPQPGPPLLPGEQAMVRVLLRRVHRRRADQRPPPLHRATEPARSGHAQAYRPSPAGLHPRPEGRSTNPQPGSSRVRQSSS